MTGAGDGYKEPASQREAVRTNDLICHVVRADGLRFCFSEAAVTHR
jgi:hypothetical protein